MLTVNIDWPIFSSPTEACGFFAGPVQLTCMPEAGKPFPWPEEWTRQLSEIFEEQSSQVWSIGDWPPPPARVRDRHTEFDLLEHGHDLLH